MARILVGTSGWSYPGHRARLEDVSRDLSSVEICSSFYRQIQPATYDRWRRETPEGFRFTLTGHRFVTHVKRLRDCEDAVTRLRDQASPLGEKLAAVAWQLPRNFHGNPRRLELFMHALDLWPEVRHTVELRHQSWFHPEVAASLRVARAAVCVTEATDFPMWCETTTDFVYARVHGRARSSALETWAERTKRWQSEGRDVYIYFDALRDARTFTSLVGHRPPSTPPR